MPRRNERAEQPGPLEFSDDLAAFVPPPPQVGRRTRLETREERDRRINAEFGRRRERNDRRADQRVAEALRDAWESCCIPGCDEPLRLTRPTAGRVSDGPVSVRLPVCTRHKTIIANMESPWASHADLEQMRERLARQRVEAVETMTQAVDLDIESNGAKQGQIYFVRLNDTIKVGWALKLRTRLKSYGAGVEVLAHYPASRQEETELHRTLRPYLARGREWYEDCPLITDVIAGVIKRHGEPTIFPTWTAPKPDVVCKRSGPLR